MKTIFIEARYAEKIRLPEKVIAGLPKKIILFTTIQYMGSLPGIKKQIKDSGRTAILIKAPFARYSGQLLGCSIGPIAGKAGCILFIGDGMFHPKALAIHNKLPVKVYDPHTKMLTAIGHDTVAGGRIKAALMAFHKSTHIGVLVSLKPGQNRLNDAIALKKHKGKVFYTLVFDAIDFSSLEDFPFIECFVNTACPRIAFDEREKFRKPVVNIDDI